VGGNNLKSAVHKRLQDCPVWLMLFPRLLKRFPSPTLTSATGIASEVIGQLSNGDLLTNQKADQGV